MSISLKNKIVFITGASSGISEACAKIFAEHGANLILCARRYDRIKKLATKLSTKYKIKSHILKLDIQKRNLIEKTIKALPKTWGYWWR